MSNRILEHKRDKALAATALLSSDRAGEVVAALAAIDRLLPAGLTARALLADAIMALETTQLVAERPEPAPCGPGKMRLGWCGVAARCLGHADRFNERELAFLGQMFDATRPPSEKQWAWLNTLLSRLEMEAA